MVHDVDAGGMVRYRRRKTETREQQQQHIIDATRQASLAARTAWRPAKSPIRRFATGNIKKEARYWRSAMLKK